MSSYRYLSALFVCLFLLNVVFLNTTHGQSTNGCGFYGPGTNGQGSFGQESGGEGEQRQENHQLDLIFRSNVGFDTPFWLQHNRYDLIPDGSSVQTGFHYQYRQPFNSSTEFIVAAELYGRTDGGFLDRPLHQAYAGLRHGNWLLSVGMREERIGMVQPELSAGPSIWSGNARPMPKIKLELQEFTPLPYTEGWVSVKGGIAHGWFESGRRVEDFYLHEKSAYLKVGKQPWPRAYVGLIHMSQWGGYDHNRHGQLPERFSDYWRVFLGRSGDETAPKGWQVNRIGNHLGSWQAGILYTVGQTDLLLNKSTIFEDGSGFTLRNAVDGAWGVNVRHHHSGSESSVGSFCGSGGVVASGEARAHYTLFTWEFWHTKHQSGPGNHVRPDDWEGHPNYDEQGNRFGGQDNYFYHGVYGHWTYFGRILGVPLITFDPELRDVTNSRLIAHHIGVEHRVGDFAVKGTWTWSKNYGIYSAPFPERLVQNYFMVGVENSLPVGDERPLLFSLEAGLDRGDHFGNRIGLLATLVYRIGG